MKSYLRVGLVSAVSMLMFVSVASATTIPSSIAGLDVWLDGSDSTTLFQDIAGTTPVTATGNSVALWKDKSGHGYNATVAGIAPTYASSELGGKSAVAFDGTAYQRLGNTGYSCSNAINVFAVVSANSWSTTPNYNYVFSAGNPGNYVGICLTGGTYEGWSPDEVLAFGNHYASPSTPRVSAPFGALANHQAAILDVSLSSSAAQIVLNGAALTPTLHVVGNSVAAKTGYILGANPDGTQNWQGNIAEILVFNHALNASDANAVGFYLQEKYGLAGSYVPEPSSIVLLFISLIGLLAYAWRKRR